MCASQKLNAQDALERCLTGVSPKDAISDQEGDYEVLSDKDGIQLRLPTNMVAWLHQQGWNSGYQLWQLRQRCAFGLCDVGSFDGIRQACASIDAALDYMAMHRHLLQRMRAKWPDKSQPFVSGWTRFPNWESYPEELQPLVQPWSDEVRYSARRLMRMGSMPQTELLGHWPTEGDFVHWLLCGSNQGGLAPDSIYGALVHNPLQQNEFGLLGSESLSNYLFWLAHYWVDRAWNHYRMRIGLTPFETELQGRVLQQCQILEGLVSGQPLPSSLIPNNNDQPLFVRGNLNSRLTNLVSLVAEIELIHGGSSQSQWLLVNPKRVGVKPFWVFHEVGFDTARIQLGDRYQFFGYPKAFNGSDAAGAPEKSAFVALITASLQSVK